MNEAIAGLVGAFVGSALTAVGALAQARGAHAQARAAQDAADAGRAQWARASRENAWVAFHDISRDIEADIYAFAVYQRAALSESPLLSDGRARKACRESSLEMQHGMWNLQEALEIVKLHARDETTAAAEEVTRACARFVRRAEWWVQLGMRQEDSMTPWDDERHAVRQARSAFEQAVVRARQTSGS